MTRTFVLAICLIFSVAVYASSEKKSRETSVAKNAVMLTGTVTDSDTGEALTGVKIEIPETKTSVYTDFEGNYNIALPENSTYKLSFQLITYQPLVDKNIETGKGDNKELNIQLKRL